MVVILAPGAICLAASARYPVVANTLSPLPGSEDPEPEPDPESEPDVLHAVTPAHSVSAANTAVKRRMSDMMTISFDCGGDKFLIFTLCEIHHALAALLDGEL